MGDESKALIIVIKRIKKGGHAHHGGAWKVAYADFVTAMMALFMVLWLLASDEKVKKSVGGYFQDPTGVGKMTGNNSHGVAEGLSIPKDEIKDLKAKIEAAMRSLPKFEQIKNNVKMSISHEGLRIELLESEKGTFFENGSAEPTDSARQMLELLCGQLKELPNKILFEGHTDAKAYNSEKYSNWELSADRANRARRLMEGYGLPDNHVGQVRGMADQQLRLPNDPTNPANRRITLLVKYEDGKPAPDAKAPPAAEAEKAEPHH